MSDDDLRSHLLNRVGSRGPGYWANIEEILDSAESGDTEPGLIRLEDTEINRPAAVTRSRSRLAPAIAASLLVVGLFAIVAVTGDRSVRLEPADSTTTTSSNPPTTEGSPVTTTDPPPSEGTRVSTQFSGFLPDGTSYRILSEPGVASDVEGISAAIMLESEADAPLVIGIQTFQRSGAEAGVMVEGDRVVASSGGWSLVIDLYEEAIVALAEIDPDLERLFTSAIQPQSGGSLPRYELSMPLRWAEDIELPLSMKIQYADFVVQRGCGELKIACSQRHGVQVIPNDRVFTPARAWDGDRSVFVESSAERPADSPHWVDPGPLSPRGGHQVLWTGGEMIVWGGATSDAPSNLTDGAAYDPFADTWRLLPDSPFDPPTFTVALWAGDLMMVVSPNDTYGYDPASDAWERLGDGTGVGRPLWNGSSAFMVNEVGVYRFDGESGDWVELSGAPAQGTDYWFGSQLSAIGDDLYLNRKCATDLSRWASDDWQDLPPVPTSITDQSDYQLCPAANQWASIDGKLIAWDNENTPTVQFDPATDSWSEIERVPVAGTEGPGGSVLVGDRLLAMGNGSALYDPPLGRWLPVELPGRGFAQDMVWTGSEVLMWGATCCYGAGDTGFIIDAWRWTPPSPVAQ